MDRGAIGFELLQLLSSPPPHLPTEVPTPASHHHQRKWPSSLLIHAPPLVSVSPSLTPHLSLQMSSHPKKTLIPSHLPLQQIPSFLLSPFLFSCLLRSSQFTAIWLFTPPCYAISSQKGHQSLLNIKWNGFSSPQPDFSTAFDLFDHPS